LVLIFNPAAGDNKTEIENGAIMQKKGFIFVGICQANNIFSHKKSAVHFSTVGITL
jgi:hypothetical protein